MPTTKRGQARWACTTSNSPRPRREIAALGADACMRLNRAVMALPDKRRNQETADLCKEIDAIETQADRVQRTRPSRSYFRRADQCGQR